MATYGLSLFGDDYYGVDVVISYSVGQVSVLQTGYGEVTLTWTTPVDQPDWSALRIVRNTAGYPADETDGDILAEFTPATPQNSYGDTGLTGGRFYYYTIFLASAWEAYSSTTLYQAGDTVSYGGNQWLCIKDNTIGVTPASGPNWEGANAVSRWNRAGQASTLAVADYGYQELLYAHLPTPYAAGQEEVSAPQRERNGLLYRYLSVLAFALDIARTELGEQQHLHRVETMPIWRMETLAQQLGVDSEASLTPRLRRHRVEHAAELAKRKGTIEAIKEAIYEQTGYDAKITTSKNLLLDADQAEFYYPRYPKWDPTVFYDQGTVVTYNGYLYTAKSSTVRVESELSPLALTGGTPNYVLQANTSTATFSNNRQVLARSTASGQGLTLTFTVPATATYWLSIGMTRSNDYGIVNFKLDGATVVRDGKTLTIDGYAAASSPATAVYLGRYSLAAGDHTVTIAVQGKNKNSSGYRFGTDYMLYTPTDVSAGIGVAPTGQATNNAYWTYTSGLASTALANPLSGGISTWEQTSGTPAVPASNTNLTLYSGHQPLNGEVRYDANLAVMTNGGSQAANLAVHSIPRARQLTWDADTTYSRGSYVTYQGATYLAILPSEGIAPDTDRIHWRPETLSVSGTDRYLVSSYGIPLARPRQWNAGRRYAPGDEVSYRDHLYRASEPTRGRPPSGDSSDTAAWAWVSSAQHAYTLSAYTRRYSGTTAVGVQAAITWFDENGAPIGTIYPDPTPNLLIPFTRTSNNVAADTASLYDLNGGTWTNTSTLDNAASSSSMVFWRTRNDSVRQLFFTHSYADGASGITFVTRPPPGIEHGLLFRRSDTNNYWAISRTRLTKCVAGAITTLASWSELPDGARIYVTRSVSTIKVFRHQGPGLAPIQLASVTDSFNYTNKGYGIFERSY